MTTIPRSIFSDRNHAIVINTTSTSGPAFFCVVRTPSEGGEANFVNPPPPPLEKNQPSDPTFSNLSVIFLSV